MTNNSNTKHVAVLGGIAIGLAIAALVLPVQLQEISAQVTNSTVPNQTQTEIPQLNGSINILEQSNQFIQQSVQVPFATALETAQAEVGNGTAISGRLGVVQGYLVYIFKLANFNAETSRIVIVDAGNGSVLHTSQDMPLFFGGLGCGDRFGGEHHFHKGFGSQWRNHDRGGGGSGETSADINSSNQPNRNPVVVSPAIGI